MVQLLTLHQLDLNALNRFFKMASSNTRAQRGTKRPASYRVDDGLDMMESELAEDQLSTPFSPTAPQKRRLGGRRSSTQRAPDMGEASAASGFEALGESRALEGQEVALRRAAEHVVRGPHAAAADDSRRDSAISMADDYDDEYILADEDVESDIGDDEVIEGPDDEDLDFVGDLGQEDEDPELDFVGHFDEEGDDDVPDEASSGLGRRVSRIVPEVDQDCVGRCRTRFRTILTSLREAAAGS
jgi:hypothetical protein